MRILTFIASIFLASVAVQAAQDEDVFKMIDILKNLNRGAQELDVLIQDWRVGNETDFQNLLDLNGRLLEAIWDANTTIAGYGGLVETDTLRLEPPVNDLTHTVSRLINHLIAKKPEVYAYNQGESLASVVHGQIAADSDAAGNTSATIVSKVPKDLQGVAKVLAAGIEDNLKRGAQYYECEKCTSDISMAGLSVSVNKAHLFALAALVAAAFTL